MATTKLNILFLSLEDRMVLEMLAYSIEEALNDISVGVLEASSEKEAMEILEFNTIDLIIADMNIDTIESYKFYDRLQKLHRFDKIPFVFLSSEIDDQEIAVLKGVQNFFLKPLNIDQLLERLTSILRDKKEQKECYILPLDEECDIEHTIHMQTLKDILTLSEEIDKLIKEEAPIKEIETTNQEITQHIKRLLASNIQENELY